MPQEAKPPVAVIAFPADVFEPTIVQFVDATLEVMVVTRRALRRKKGIDREIWAVPGAYVLIGNPAERTSVVRVRPGKANDLLTRMNDHLGDDEMNWFTRAVLIRDTRQFNSAQAGSVEGALHRICRDAAGIEHDWKMDKDETLSEQDQKEIDERYLPKVRALLELVGLPTETETQAVLEDEKEILLRPAEGETSG